MASDPWIRLREEDQWLADLMDELLDDTTKSPEQLTARANQLRAEAEHTDLQGYRVATLALADRYELAARARLGAS